MAVPPVAGQPIAGARLPACECDHRGRSESRFTRGVSAAGPHCHGRSSHDRPVSTAARPQNGNCGQMEAIRRPFAAANHLHRCSSGLLAGKGRRPACRPPPNINVNVGSTPSCATAHLQILILFRIGYCAAMRRTVRRKPPQPALPWPGTDETCPRCHGTKQVYYRAAPDGVEIVGGKRMPCPVCQGVGTVRTPLTPRTRENSPSPSPP